MPIPALKSSPVVPLYHPTSIILVDNDPSACGTLREALGDSLECLCFARAEAALEFVEAERADLSRMIPACAPEADNPMEHIKDPAERVLHRYVARLPRLFADNARFGRASVLVLNDRMAGPPEFERLQALRDQPLRRVLLGGQAAENGPRRALEEGCIDAHLPEPCTTLDLDLAEHLRVLQFGYFQRLTKPLAPALHSPDTRFLHNAGFPEVFAEFVLKHGVIEHCVLMHPPGILGIDQFGRPAILLVADEDYRQASFEIAQAEGAPVALLGQLMSAQRLAVFPTSSGFYAREMKAAWQQFIWPSSPLGDTGLQVATICAPEVITRVCGKVVSFAEHLRRLN